MDQLSKEHRSWNMSRIRSKNTSPEKAMRSLLHRLGYRFRLHRKDLPGQPDIVLPRFQTVIFVHGCYWHRHKSCKYAYTPKTHIEFWQRKFDENVERDKRILTSISKRGWRILIVWECEISNEESLTKRLTQFLDESQAAVVLRNRENSSGNI